MRIRALRPAITALYDDDRFTGVPRAVRYMPIVAGVFGDADLTALVEMVLRHFDDDAARS